MTLHPILRAGLAALGLTASGTCLADLSWVRIGNAANPSLTYVEAHNGFDLSAQGANSWGRACYVSCPRVELRFQSRANPSGLATSHTHSQMTYALQRANGQPLTPGELFQLGSIVLRFRITGQHALPPLGVTGFSYSAVVLPFGHLSAAGRSYEGQNERTATGLQSQSTLTQYKLDQAKPKTTVSSLPAEIHNTRFAIEVPAESSGTLEWHIAGQVDGLGGGKADYRIVLDQVLFTGTGVPGAGFGLSHDLSHWQPLEPRTPGGGD